MRKMISCLIAVVLFGGAEKAVALNNVERAIMKCRTSALNAADQVSCLENALREMVQSTGDSNWAGATTPPTIAEADTAVVTTPDSVVHGLGAEQVRLKQQDFKSFQRQNREESVVADFAYNQSERLILVLANGQVWKQRTGDLNHVRIEKGATPKVVVRPGAISGYRMEFPELGETIIVTRLQ